MNLTHTAQSNALPATKYTIVNDSYYGLYDDTRVQSNKGKLTVVAKLCILPV